MSAAEDSATERGSSAAAEVSAGDREPRGVAVAAWRVRLRRWARRLGIAALAAVMCGLVAFTALVVAVYGFRYPVETLRPDRGGPLVITDRHGQILRAVPGEAHRGRPGRSRWVPLDRIPSLAVLTVIASEDERFFEHAGVDAQGVARAAWLNAKAGRLAYGGSTLTMQLVRMLRGTDRERTVWAKLSEAVLAMRLERAMDKRAILEQYLNRAYYGNGAYGLEAAARRYFDKPAVSLSASEATLLAIVPRSPAAYDPVSRLDAALRRRDHVFGLLAARGLMTAGEIERARAQPLEPALHQPPFEAPHFVDWVIASLPEEVRARGGEIRTTLDLSMQRELERRLRDHVDSLSHRGLDHAGAVILDTRRGEVLAMVGSAGRDRPDGEINIVTWRRHPGSALKPFVYALAIEAGDHPATIVHDIHDVPSAYRVTHLTQREHGPVRYREALAGSYNLAAIHVLEKVGLERLMSVLRRAGVGPLDGLPTDYGLRLALGSARIRLIDLAAAYGFLVRGGKVARPVGVVEATSDEGVTWRPQRALERRIFSRETSWLVMDMLADPTPRHATFGQELPLDLPYPVAAKTGTSRGFADTVAVGVTREITAAAWAGNFDGDPTQGLIAMKSAAPLVRAGLQIGARGRRLSLPDAPPEIIEAQVCPLSGMAPSEHCPHRKREYFRAGQVPREPCDWHRPGGVVRYPAEARAWARDRHRRAGRVP